jgi:hypothetical protein
VSVALLLVGVLLTRSAAAGSCVSSQGWCVLLGTCIGGQCSPGASNVTCQQPADKCKISQCNPKTGELTAAALLPL